MPAAVSNRFPGQHQGENADCAIVALSMYLGVSYEDVLREVALVDKRNNGRAGLWTRQIKQVARRLGHELVVKRKVDLDEDYGILLLFDHIAVLRNGLLLETNGEVWDIHDYLAALDNISVEGILVVPE